MPNSPAQIGSLQRRRIIIAGGGLAGIAAALRLAEHGAVVTLVETRKRLGGRATSFDDPQTGQTLDNCQHVLMGCCTNLLDLYARLGVSDAIEWHRKLNFIHLSASAGVSHSLRPSHPMQSHSHFNGAPPAIDVLEADDLPAPLHMTRALMAFKSLSLWEKLAISRGMLAIMRLSRRQRDALHDTSFAQWLVDHGQPAGAIDKFWAPVVISALNELPQRTAADYAIHVFQDGFLASADAYVVGLSRVPLVRLYDAAENAIAAAGGQVMLSESAERLVFDGKQVAGLQLADGRVLKADDFVSALPADRLAKVCDASMVAADARLQRLDQFASSPILGIHLWFDCPDGNPVMTLPHVTLTGSPLQWIFNKGVEPEEAGDAVGPALPADGDATSGQNAKDHDRADDQRPALPALPPRAQRFQHLHGVISAAHDLVDQPAEAILSLIVGEVRRALPGARNATLLRGRVIKEKRATFSPRPGVDALRPAAGGAIDNLFLAGDYCRSGWPATMEGAVRSGYLAAAALLQRCGVPESPHATGLVPDLPADTLYRLIAGRP